MNATGEEAGGESRSMVTSCSSSSGGFNMFSASDSPRRISGGTEVISIVESSSMEAGGSKVGEVGVDEDVGSGINSV